jgi:RNA polymerase sigma factor (sigma-70 family)
VVAIVDFSVALGFMRTTRRVGSRVVVPRKACGHQTDTDPCFECFYRANDDDFRRWATRLSRKHRVLEMSDDVLLEASEKLLARWRKITIDNPRAYMYTALESKALDAAQQRGIGKGAPRPGDVPLDATTLVVAGGGPDPESEVLRAERQRIVEAALRALPKREQDVATCRYLLELSVAETAAQLGMSPSAVGSAFERANKKLRAALDRLDGGETT